jgi:serine phosphatase RsbU (regulator of sigma subunit)
MKQMKLLYIVVILLSTTFIAGCNNQKKHAEIKASSADSVIFNLGLSENYAQMLVMVDSFEQSNSISQITANRWRGVAYYRQRQYRSAEYYYKKVIEGTIATDEDQLSYNKAARRLSELLLVKGDFEGSIEVAVTAVKIMKETNTGSDIDFAILLNNIGCCQLNLGLADEANNSFLEAREHYANRWENDSTGRGLQEAVVGTVYTSQAYINTKRFDEAQYWIDRTEMLLNRYRQKADARVEYLDEYQGRLEIMRAVALQGMGKKEEAKLAYMHFSKTTYANTSAGRIYANDYLLAAGRYKEAADNYTQLDRMLSETNMELSLDNIHLYLLPKLRANIGANRRDSALVISQQLCDVVDSAIVKAKEDDTAELATIYDTQQKEAQIAHQQADMSRQRFWATAIAFFLFVVFTSIYSYNRRKSAHKLADAHTKLQMAYDQLEETTAAKERIESELRIARDIQMSMVPNIFPDYPGLDIFAAMTPAKEVGGDLYGYLLLDNILYFCIGDVSGKGVPASLFMAQATRLFRTLATQRMMPDEIATRMNAILSEDNEQGMFVTMFIGLVNLKTGHLDFCNAGHNPPVFNGSFINMESNAPIGLWPNLKYEGESIETIKNHIMFVYTDGLTEAENKEQQQFGEDRLLGMLRNNKSNTARQIVMTLKDQVDKHRNGADPNDDLTMMCLKVTIN